MNILSLSVMSVGVVLVVLVTAQVWLLWRLTRVLASAARVEERVGLFAEALSLLTETTESGFRAVADELGRRREDAAGYLQNRAATSRVAAAVRRGRSIPEIAAAESLSEGEVRLRLHMTGPSATPKAAKPVDKATPAPKTLAAARGRRTRTEQVNDVRA